jgi:hypothetical protein
MGVDHVVDLECNAKRALGVETIVNLLKSRSRADAILHMSRQNGDNRPPEQITFKVAVQRPTGVETQDVSVAMLFQQAAGLDPHRSGCASCPANAGMAAGFGCVRYLNYPIEQRTEQWLWSRLPQDMRCTAGHFLQRAIADFGWDGAPSAKMRAQGRTFFESPTPLSGSWPDGFSFTSDQLFHMLFHVGHLGATHSLMVALFLGVLPHDLDPQILGDRARRAQMLGLAGVPPQEGQREQMAEVLRALVMAARLEVDLLVDG